MSYPGLGVFDGYKPQIQWPVAVWKSPGLRVDGTTELYYTNPAPSSAYIDMGMECVAATDAQYVLGDITRAQRGYIGGAFDFIHPCWDESRHSHFLACRNLSNSYALCQKTSGVCTFGLTSTNWFQRIYAAWPLVKNSQQFRNLDRKTSATMRSQGIKILRKKFSTPWRRPAAFPFAESLDLRQFGHNEEPPILQVWARCIDTDQAYQTGHEMILLGGDVTAGTGVAVWANGSQVGYTIASAGVSIINNATAAKVALTPGKWIYQARMAFACDMDDIITFGHAGRGIVGMHYSRWTDLTLGGRLQFQLPSGFDPIDIGVGVRCKVGAAAALAFLQNDQVYSRHSGYLNTQFIAQILVDGRKVIIQLDPTNPSMTAKDGPGGAAWSANDYEIQIRAIG